MRIKSDTLTVGKLNVVQANSPWDPAAVEIGKTLRFQRNAWSRTYLSLMPRHARYDTHCFRAAQLAVLEQ